MRNLYIVMMFLFVLILSGCSMKGYSKSDFNINQNQDLNYNSATKNIYIEQVNDK